MACIEFPLHCNIRHCENQGQHEVAVIKINEKVNVTWLLNLSRIKANKTRHVFVKHGCPRQQQSRNMAKISKSYILTTPHPQGHVMSVKCEQPIDELTVQVWLLYHNPNCKYCTLFVSGTELRTDGQTDRQTDKRTDRQTNDPITRCPRRTFQAGGIKIQFLFPMYSEHIWSPEHPTATGTLSMLSAILDFSTDFFCLLMVYGIREVYSGIDVCR